MSQQGQNGATVSGPPDVRDWVKSNRLSVLDAETYAAMSRYAAAVLRALGQEIREHYKNAASAGKHKMAMAIQSKALLAEFWASQLERQ